MGCLVISTKARACTLCGALHSLSFVYSRCCCALMNKPFLSGEELVRDVRQSCVYVVGVLADQTSVVKFCYTKALEERLRAIQTGSPVKLHVIASSFGAKREESAIHKHLAGDRLYGEWFTRSERAIRVIEAMQRNGIAEM